MSEVEKCGIVLMNTGTPSAPTPRAVRKYLRQFLMHKRIAPMNRVIWAFVLHLFILPSRGKASAEKYRRIWREDGSPLMVAHEKLAKGLQQRFLDQGYTNVFVTHAMSYGDPLIQETLKNLRNKGCKRIIVLPLYPQSAYCTTGAVNDEVSKALQKMKWDVDCRVIDNYHDNTQYVKTIAASIRHAGFNLDSDDKILFSLHSAPLSDIEAGDTYELQVGASCLQIASELGIDRTRWTIGYQSRFEEKRSWLSPFTKDVLERWAEAGVGRVFYICPGFSVDCLETLYDIPHEMEPHYKERLRHYHRDHESQFIYVPCLDRSKAHVKVLMSVVSPYIEKD